MNNSIPVEKIPNYEILNKVFTQHQLQLERFMDANLHSRDCYTFYVTHSELQKPFSVEIPMEQFANNDQPAISYAFSKRLKEAIAQSNKIK